MGLAVSTWGYLGLFGCRVDSAVFRVGVVIGSPPTQLCYLDALDQLCAIRGDRKPSNSRARFGVQGVGFRI